MLLFENNIYGKYNLWKVQFMETALFDENTNNGKCFLAKI